MASDDLATLRAAHAATSEGLISGQDYDVVKQAFLRAQQLRAGYEAGFIRDTDYARARDAYISALDFTVMAAHPSLGGPPPAPANGHGGAGHAAGQQRQGHHDQAPRPHQQQQQQPQQEQQQQHHHHQRRHQQHHPRHHQQHPNGAANGHASAGGAPQRAAAARAPHRGPAGGAAPPRDVPDYVRGATAGKVSMAGIGVTPDCINLFMHMQRRSAFKWITYRVDDSGKFVTPEAVGYKGSAYEEFVAALNPAECRYGVYDYEYNSRERGSFSKLVFVNWAPEGCTIKQKMMYAATKDFFKGFMEGIGAELQANEAEDLSEEELRTRVGANLTRK